MASRASSPYHDLGRWESEGNLIQLETPQPCVIKFSSRGYTGGVDGEGGEARVDPRS